MPWLLDAAFQPNTSSVMVSLNSRLMNSTAATVFSELITTCSFSSWIDAPCDHMSARMTMLESISWDMPRPIWMPLLFLISAPILSRSSQLVGPSAMPAPSHRLLRKLPGSGTQPGENAEYLPVVGLNEDLRHSSICWPQRRLAASV